MKEYIITNTACLLCLEKIEGLDVLPTLFKSVIVTPATQQEFGVMMPWLQLQVPSDGGMNKSLRMLVDNSEAEAIALAYELGCRIILDDQQARAVAQNIGVSVIGTLGILIKAKQAGLIFSLKPILLELERQKFYFDPALKQEALRMTEEA